jgi:biopolymer transport protein ExbD
MKSRRDRPAESPLKLTSMIDIVFLLLIFFLVTAHQPIPVGRLDVDRPSRGEPGPQGITIRVYPSGYMVGHRRMSLRQLDSALANLAMRSPEQNVVVICTDNSSHGQLVKALDLCAKAGMQNVSVISMSSG